MHCIDRRYGTPGEDKNKYRNENRKPSREGRSIKSLVEAGNRYVVRNTTKKKKFTNERKTIPA
jgi:hypothetical protein